MDYRLFTDTIYVRCPFSNGMRYTVFIRYAVLDDGRKFYFPSDGCCNMSGANTCSRCCDYVTRRLNDLDCSDGDYSDFAIG